MDEERFEQERHLSAQSWSLDELAARRQGLFELAVVFQDKVRHLSTPTVSFSIYKILSKMPKGSLETINPRTASVLP